MNYRLMFLILVLDKFVIHGAVWFMVLNYFFYFKTNLFLYYSFLIFLYDFVGLHLDIQNRSITFKEQHWYFIINQDVVFTEYK